MPLVLDLLRHGEAEAPGAGGDAARPLSAAGREALARLAGLLAAEGWSPDRIFSSPLLRARQTAEIVREAAPNSPAVEGVEELSADGDPSAVLELLSDRAPEARHVLLVTHQPLVGLLATLLAGGELPFPAGTLVRIECAAGAVPGGCRVIRSVQPGFTA